MSELQSVTKQQTIGAVDSLDKENPRSPYNLLPTVMQQYVDAIPDSIKKLPEVELQNHFKKSMTIDNLRNAFWEEYVRTQVNHKNIMSLTEICNGVCTLSSFHDKYGGGYGHFELMYILTPPIRYEIAMSSVLNALIGRIYDVANLPLTKKVKKGKRTEEVVDVRVVTEIRKLFELVHPMKMGSVVQRIQQETVNKQVVVETDDLEQIEARIVEAEKVLEQ